MKVVAKKSVTRPATTRSIALPMPPPATQPRVAARDNGSVSSLYAMTAQAQVMTAAMSTNSAPLPSPIENAAPALYTSERSITCGMRVTGEPGVSDARAHTLTSWSSATTRAAAPAKRPRRRDTGVVLSCAAKRYSCAATASWQRQQRPSAPRVR